MAKAKTNYTDEMVLQMVDTYGAATTDETRAAAVTALAEALGRSVPSIRTKLAQLKVYVKPGKAKAATKGDTVTKAEMVATIESRIGLEVGTGKSLNFATKAVLQAVLDSTDPVEVAAEADSGDAAQEGTES